ncbi:hypothetical protein GCM10023333_02150 [Ferrimonas pelagia]|uniref:Uncharacterized protein n=1 Tax=Ferrimonas pelagia TaxID=1177826 RepID=A0ABP9ED49_9GAMM
MWRLSQSLYNLIAIHDNAVICHGTDMTDDNKHKEEDNDGNG